MGFIWKTVTKNVPCDHIGSSGDYCSKCGAKKNISGFGYDLGFVQIEERVMEPCSHLGEIGEYCSKCGDRLHFSKDPF